MHKFIIKITEENGEIKSEFDMEANLEIKIWFAKHLSQNEELKEYIKEAIVFAEEENIDYDSKLEALYTMRDMQRILGI